MLAGSVHEETSRCAATHRRDTLLFRRAGEVHTQQYGDDGARCFSFFLPAEWNERHGAAPSQSDSFTGVAGSRANSLVRRMYSEFRDPDACSAMAMEGLALELVAETSRIGRRPKAAWLREARARLEQADARAAVRIDTLARELNVDAGHLVRSFRRAYGISPATFVRRRRLETAYRLVLESDSRLSDIALSTGFFDQSHFTRAFVAHFGVPPGSLRRSR
jgi:AraC family transcriptional regulator